MKITLHNQTCHLLAEKAVYWEERKTLIIADLHLGKTVVFQKAGIPIPPRILEDDLEEMTHLIQKWGAEKCIIVGDLIHAETGLTFPIIDKFSHWLQEIGCEVHLVLGNHDRALLKNLPSEWSLHIHTEKLLIKPFYFSHYPIQQKPWFVWSGHLHPKVEISNHYDKLVLRCFQIFPNYAILPAFSFFVGGTLVKKSKNSKIYAIANHSVLEIK